MPAKQIIAFCKENLFPIQSTNNLCSPYHGENPTLDIPGAASLRRQNLLNYLHSFPALPPALFVGEAPGPRGCRFSGIPFTSERQLIEQSLPFSGKATSTFKSPTAERSATIIWETLISYHPHFLLWNSLPLHPHHPDDALSIRTPSGKELKEYSYILLKLIQILKPKIVVAIGRKAEYALIHLDIDCSYVRHPSHGGKSEFQLGIRKVLREITL